MPSDSHNSTMAGLTFSSLQPERCLLPYCCTYNAFFLDLLLLYPIHLCSLQSVDFVVSTWWLQTKSRLWFSKWLFWLQKFFSNSCWFVLLHNDSCQQMIIDMTGLHGAIVWCSMRGFSSNNKAVPHYIMFHIIIIIVYPKKANKQVQ